MPRATWATLPDDVRAWPDYIEKILNVSKSRTVQGTRYNHSKRREADLRTVDFRDQYAVNSKHFLLAVIIQQRGEIPKRQCECCTHGDHDNLPFKTCIRLPTEQHGRCANCVYSTRICSLGDIETQRKHIHQPTGHVALLNPYDRPTNPKKRKIESMSKSLPSQRYSVAHNISQGVEESAMSTSGPPESTQTTDSDNFIILGDLVLPRPPKEYESTVLRYEEGLRALNRRDMNELSNTPIINLGAAFNHFRSREVKIWKSVLQQDQSPKLLVRPSGSLESPIAYHLNQPSYTTKHPENGEVADCTNNCISMLMGNLYDNDTLLFDHVYRREDRSDAIEQYHAEVLACHEEFQNDISHSMKAKVELVWGDKVRKRLLVLYGDNANVFPLWGEFEGIFAWLLHEDSFRNADPRFQFRRMVLTAYHPNFMFYQGVDSQEAILQDKIMKAAALMVGRHQLSWIPAYYARKKWLCRTVPCLFSSALLRSFSHQSTDSSTDAQDVLKGTQLRSQNEQLQTSQGGIWDPFFTKYSYSNNQLRELIPPAIEAIQSCDSFVKWEHFLDLPLAIQKWLQGQKQILFSDTPISSFDDVVEALKGTQGSRKSAAKSLKDNLLSIMEIQQDTLRGVGEMYQDAWHSRFTGEIIEVKCKDCGDILTPDSNPRYAVYRPGYYVIRHRRCRGEIQRAIPVNEQICYVNTDIANIRLPSRRAPQAFDIAQYTQAYPNSVNYPSTVHTHCSDCKELTRLADGSSVFVDVDPKYTNQTPSFYVAPMQPCLRCHELKKGRGKAYSTVFVPIDKSIEYTFRVTIKRFHQVYGNLEMDIKLLLLRDYLRPSSRWWKGKTISG